MREKISCEKSFEELYLAIGGLERFHGPSVCSFRISLYRPEGHERERDPRPRHPTKNYRIIYATLFIAEAPQAEPCRASRTNLPVYISRHVIFDELSFPFAERPDSTSPGLLTSPSDSATPNTTGSVITLPLPITQDPQATMAPPPPAAVTDTSADVGTTYATADTTVDANSSEVLSDVPSIPLLVDLSAPATDDSILSSTLVLPAQQPPAPHSSSTSGSIHPMVTRSRDGTRRPRAFCSMQSTPHPLLSPYAALLASSSSHEPTSFKEASKDSRWVSAMKDDSSSAE